MTRDLVLTSDSITAAKQYCQQERDRIFRITGLQVSDAQPLTIPPLVVVGCERDQKGRT